MLAVFVLRNAQPVGRAVCTCTWYYFDLLTCFFTLLCFKNACLAMRVLSGRALAEGSTVAAWQVSYRSLQCPAGRPCRVYVYVVIL